MSELMNEKKYLNGKFALITGSSRGIGRGIALKLAEKGVTVAVNYLKDETAANDTLTKIKELGSDGFIVQADVSNPKDIARMVSEVREKFGKLDIFVSNALGNLLGFMSPPLQVSLEQWEEAYQAQSRAFLVGVQQVAGLISDKGRYWLSAIGLAVMQVVSYLILQWAPIRPL